MKINAYGEISAESIKLLTNISFFGKEKPIKKALIYIVVFLLFGVLAVAQAIIRGFDSLTLLLIFPCVISVFLLLYIYFLLPNLRIKAMEKVIGIVNYYEFTDDSFCVSAKSEAVNGIDNVKYNFIKTVFETEEYFFLLLQNDAAFIVEKKSVNDDEVGVLKSKLKTEISEYVNTTN